MNIAHLKKLGIVIFIGWCMRGKGEDMKKRRKPITTERSRIWETQGQKRYIWLNITNGMSHDGIRDELFEDFMRAYQRITFPTVEIPEDMPCIRSERTSCIAPEDAAIVDGKLRLTSLHGQLTRVDSSESQIWHFAGGIWLIDSELCFCEYDASKRKGGMFIFFEGKDTSKLLAKYPQFKHKIQFIKRDQYDWLVNNW